MVLEEKAFCPMIDDCNSPTYADALILFRIRFIIWERSFELLDYDYSTGLRTDVNKN